MLKWTLSEGRSRVGSWGHPGNPPCFSHSTRVWPLNTQRLSIELDAQRQRFGLRPAPRYSEHSPTFTLPILHRVTHYRALHIHYFTRSLLAHISHANLNWLTGEPSTIINPNLTDLRYIVSRNIQKTTSIYPSLWCLHLQTIPRCRSTLWRFVEDPISSSSIVLRLFNIDCTRRVLVEIYENWTKQDWRDMSRTD